MEKVILISIALVFMVWFVRDRVRYMRQKKKDNEDIYKNH